jgi:hypothetical protein
MKKFIFLFTLILSSTVFVHSVYAKESSLTIYPSLTEININRNDNYTEYVNIYNSGSKPIALKVFAQNFGVTGLNGSVDFINDKSKFASSSWFHFKQTLIAMAPYETLHFPVDIKVPNNAYPGGHYVAVFFQKINNINKNKSIAIVSRIGALFFLSVGGNVYYDAKLTNIDLKSNVLHLGNFYFPFISMNNFDVISTIKNLSNDYIIENGSIYLDKSNNQRKTISNIPQHIILQKEKRKIVSNVKESLSFGQYNIYSSIRYGYNQGSIDSKSIIILPIYFIILTSLVILFILYIVTFKKKFLFKYIKEKYEKVHKKIR